MRRARRLGAGPVVLALTLLASACTYYPTVHDVGGVRLRPEQGRVVRAATAGEAVLYLDVESSGKYGDVLTGAQAPFAQQAALIGPAGAPVGSIAIPPATVFKFREDGPRIVLSGLTRALTPGEIVIVTLKFKKSGPMGVVSVVQ
jgi:copper(I)-binding protein